MQSGLFLSLLPENDRLELPRSFVLRILSLDRLLRPINLHSTDLPSPNLQKLPAFPFFLLLIPIPYKIEDDRLLLVIKLLRSGEHFPPHNHLLRVHLLGRVVKLYLDGF